MKQDYFDEATGRVAKSAGFRTAASKLDVVDLAAEFARRGVFSCDSSVEK